MTAEPIIRKELWREASDESMLLLRHIEALCVVLQHSASDDDESLPFIKELLLEQEPFNQHMHTIQEKEQKGAGATHQDWSKVVTMTVSIASRLMTLQDAIEENSPEAALLESAGQHLEKLSKLVEQLRGTPCERATLDTSA